MLSLFGKEALWQLFAKGPTWDGNIVSKEGREELIDFKLAVRHEGWTILTLNGLKRALSLDMDHRKDAEDNHHV